MVSRLATLLVAPCDCAEPRAIPLVTRWIFNRTSPSDEEIRVDDRVLLIGSRAQLDSAQALLAEKVPAAS